LRGEETILVVDEDALVRTTLRRLLGRHGHTVLEARSADEGLALAREELGVIHLMLVDSSTLGVDDQDVRGAIRGGAASMRFVCMSAYSNDGPAPSPRARRSSPKPFTSEELLRRIREELDGSKIG